MCLLRPLFSICSCCCCQENWDPGGDVTEGKVTYHASTELSFKLLLLLLLLLVLLRSIRKGVDNADVKFTKHAVLRISGAKFYLWSLLLL